MGFRMKNFIFVFFMVYFNLGVLFAEEGTVENVDIGSRIEKILARKGDHQAENDPIVVAELINIFEECDYYNDSFLQADFSASTSSLLESMLEHFSHYLLSGKMRGILFVREFVYPIEKLNQDQVELLDDSGLARILGPYLINRLDFKGFIWEKLLSPYLSEQKQIRMYQRLKSFGIGAKYLEREGVYPLHIALRQQHINFARLLLADGAKHKLRDKRHCTPQIIAVAKGLSLD